MYFEDTLDAFNKMLLILGTLALSNASVFFVNRVVPFFRRFHSLIPSVSGEVRTFIGMNACKLLLRGAYSKVTFGYQLLVVPTYEKKELHTGCK